MTLRILTCVGASPNSGVPIYRVECSECGEQYRRVGFPWDIKRHSRCAACAGALKRKPGTQAERRNLQKRIKRAELRKIRA
jgi:hypothetical protein